MRVRTLVVGLFVFNLVMGVAATGTGGSTNIAYFAHIGGVIAAYVYVRMAATAGIDQVRQRVAELPDVDEPPRAIPRNLPRRERGDEVDDIVAKSKAAVAKRTVLVTRPPRRSGETRADELNRVLDKISEHGIESLTPDERKVLEEMSKKLRDSGFFSRAFRAAAPARDFTDSSRSFSSGIKNPATYSNWASAMRWLSPPRERRGGFAPLALSRGALFLGSRDVGSSGSRVVGKLRTPLADHLTARLPDHPK
jgi:hypothetical protein